MLAVILLVSVVQGPPPTATARAVAKPPVIDGHLTDSMWHEAPVIAGFVQRELHEGEAVTERTEVRIITDGDALYVGAWLYDSEPAAIVPGAKVRDGDITKSDYFGILLDTFHDRQNGFVFTTTPTAIEYDAQVVNEGEGGGVQLPGQTAATAGALGGFNVNWDGTWTVATSVDSAGWYAEFRIPFTTLRFGAGETQTWGLNLVRSIRRKSEEAFWSFIPRQFSLMKISLGLDPQNPGGKRVRIAPRPGGGFTHARSSLEMPSGPLASSWKLEPQSFALDVTVPPNTVADVTLWGTTIDRIREAGRPLSGVPGVRGVQQRGSDVVVTIGSGEYGFTVSR
jgi:hypothetical protein